MTYYEILEVSENASPEVIRTSYRALCKKYHPDVYQGDKKYAEEKMKEINEAYDTLSDEAKKREYDYSLNARNEYAHGGRQENTPFTIYALLKRGFTALEAGNPDMALCLFWEVLKLEPQNAEAYLGKLMVELRVSTREDLKNLSQPFNTSINYQKAFSFGDDSLKEFLTGTIQFINKRNYEKICRPIYDAACALMREDSIRDLKYAVAEFEKIREYKDSEQKIEQCYQRIAEINAAILAVEAERQKRKEERKQKNIAKLQLFKKIAIIVIPVLIVAILAATILSYVDWNKGDSEDNSSSQTSVASKPTNINYGSKEIKESYKETQSDGVYTITDYNSASQIIYKSTYGPNGTRWSAVDFQFDASGEYYLGFVESQFFESGQIYLYCEVDFEPKSKDSISAPKRSYKEYYHENGEIQKIVDIEYESLQDEYTFHICAKTVRIYYTKDKILAEKFIYQNSVNNGNVSAIETHYKYDNNGSIISEVITNNKTVAPVW